METFFNTLFAKTKGFIEIRSLPDMKQYFFADIAKIPDYCKKKVDRKQNCYFGVGTRKGQKGTKESVSSIPALWADIDFKDISEDEAKNRIENFPLKPTILLDSGGGYHLYWILTEPVIQNFPEVERYLKGLADALGGDRGATDLARIMRVPGTLNYKYNPPREVQIIHLNGNRYSLSDFEPYKAKIDNTYANQNWPEKIKGVPKGLRNQTLYQFAQHFAIKGLPYGELLELAHMWIHNLPDKSDISPREIESTVRSAFKSSVVQNRPVDSETTSLTFPNPVICGIAGEFADTYSKYLEVPASFLYTAYLACLGNILCGSVTVLSELRPQPRLYLVLLGESADDRKSTAANRTIDFFRGILAEGAFNVNYGLGSAEGLAKVLGRQPQLLVYFDELKLFCQKSKIEGSTLLPAFNTLFESNRFHSETKSHSISIENAYVSMIGCSTLETYSSMFNSQFLDIGFLNRLFIVIGHGERKYALPRIIPSDVKKGLSHQLKDVLSFVNRLSDKKPYPMPVNQDALDLFQEWYMNLERSPFTKRLDTYGHRLMPLLAINEKKDRIDLATMQKTIALLEYELVARKEADPIDADNRIAKLEERIRRKLSQGSMKSRDLEIALHKNRYGNWAWSHAIENLKRAGEIGYSKKEGKFWLRGD